jgi:hypothetical protein
MQELLEVMENLDSGMERLVAAVEESMEVLHSLDDTCAAILAKLEND